MKSRHLIAAVIGVLALASANANASVDSSSFVVGIRIAAPCDVSTSPGPSGVAVNCQSPSTPYRIERGADGSADSWARTCLAEVTATGPQDTSPGEQSGYARTTVTF